MNSTRATLTPEQQKAAEEYTAALAAWRGGHTAEGSAMSKTIRVPASAHAQIAQYAAARGVTLKAYIEALLNYAISCERRPGSWEACEPFDVRTYTRPDSVADRWF